MPQPREAGTFFGSRGNPWWEEAFQAAYLEVYAHRGDEDAAEEIAGLLPFLHAPVLDAGCGAGRHLAALRASGMVAYGLDLSRPLLSQAWCRTPGGLIRGDLRRPPFAAGAFPTVLVLFTAFGYFDDVDNAACLSALGGMLSPGGRLVLDLPDPDRLIAELRPETRRLTPRGWLVEERRRIAGPRVVKDVRVTPPGALGFSWQEDVRIYRRPELESLARSCGLRIDAVWGGLRGPAADAGRLVAWLAAA